MGAIQKIDPALAASVLEWWHDAGVDVTTQDVARDWLAPPPRRKTDSLVAPSAAAAPQLDLPATLPAFLAWRVSDAAPEAAMPGLRIAPSGPAEAPIMVVVEMPEADDRADQLLGGPAGALFDRMLAAIGQSRASVHLAALCVSRAPGGRVPEPLAPALAAVLHHHVALVGARRLLLLGNATSRALIGMDAAPARGALQPVNHRGSITAEAVTSFHPRFLLDRPGAKAEAWRDLQLLIRGLP